MKFVASWRKFLGNLGLPGGAGAVGSARNQIVASWRRGVVAQILGYRAHKATFRKRSALPITLTLDRLMAAAAIIGDSSMPETG